MSYEEKFAQAIQGYKDDPELMINLQGGFIMLINEMMNKLHQLGVYEEFKQEIHEKFPEISSLFLLIIESKPESIKEGWE